MPCVFESNLRSKSDLLRKTSRCGMKSVIHVPTAPKRALLERNFD